jgi:hypothetical protein
MCHFFSVLKLYPIQTIPACKHWPDWIVSGVEGPEMDYIIGKQRMWIFCSCQNKSLIKVGTGRLSEVAS